LWVKATHKIYLTLKITVDWEPSLAKHLGTTFDNALSEFFEYIDHNEKTLRDCAMLNPLFSWVPEARKTQV